MVPILCINTCTHVINVYKFKLVEFKSNLLIVNFTTASDINTIGSYLISIQPLLSEKNQKPLQAYCTKQAFTGIDFSEQINSFTEGTYITHTRTHTHTHTHTHIHIYIYIYIYI